MPASPPRRAWAIRATRLKTTPLILTPVAVGSALGVGSPTASWGWFAVAMVGAACLHLGSMVVNDVFDTRSRADKIASMDRTGLVTASGLIDDGVVTERQMLTLAGSLFAIAGVLGVIAGTARTGAVLWLGLAGAAIGVGYVAPPLRLGYRGRGLGQVATLAAYGPLATAGAFAVQAKALTAEAFWAGIVPGLLVTGVYVVGDVLHHRADKAVEKRTPASIFGAEGALLVAAGVTVAAYAALVLQVAASVFSAWALIGLLPAVPWGAAWQRAFSDPAPQRTLNLLGASLGAAVLTGGVMAVATALASV